MSLGFSHRDLCCKADGCTRVAKQIVNERLASDDPYRKDMLGSFLSHGLTREEAEGESLVQILAGSDTTATALRTTLLYLMSTPKAYARLAAEIRAAAAENRISSPVSDAEARELPYLQAVIREGLRVFPPVAGSMDVVVPPGGDLICDKYVPEGTEVGISVFSVQHLTSVYGDDAEMFRPERWLEAGEEEERRMANTWALIFKAGKWQCLGKDVALLELNKVFVEVSPPLSGRAYSLSRVAADPMPLLAVTAVPTVRLHPCRPGQTVAVGAGGHLHPVRPVHPDHADQPGLIAIISDYCIAFSERKPRSGVLSAIMRS